MGKSKKKVEIYDENFVNRLKGLNNTIYDVDKLDDKLCALYNKFKDHRISTKRFKSLGTEIYNDVFTAYISGLEKLLNKKIETSLMLSEYGWEKPCMKFQVIGGLN